jgi:hypothetical protein
MKTKKNSETYSSKVDSYEDDSISLSSDENSSNNLYEAEEIIGKKIKKGRVLYKVKWKDYPINQSTWEPISNFNNSSYNLIKKFENSQKEKIKKLATKGIRSSIEDKRFSKRLKVMSKKNFQPVEEIIIEDSDSDVSVSSHCENEKKKKKRKSSLQEEDSSIDSNDLSPASSDSSTKKIKRTEYKVVENGRTKNITHRSKKAFFKSKRGDIKHDKVKRIISGKIIDAKNFQLNCLVEFDKRTDGYTPEPRNYSSELIRVHAPQSLIDFYQSRISINKKSP